MGGIFFRSVRTIILEAAFDSVLMKLVALRLQEILFYILQTGTEESAVFYLLPMLDYPVTPHFVDISLIISEFLKNLVSIFTKVRRLSCVFSWSSR